MLRTTRRLNTVLPPAPGKETNQLPVTNNGRKVVRQRSEPTRAGVRQLFSPNTGSGAHATVSTRLDNALPAQGRRQALQPLPTRGPGAHQAGHAQAGLHELSDAHLAQSLGKEKAKIISYAHLANETLRFNGETTLHTMYRRQDPRLDNFKARGVFAKGTQPQNAPHPSDDPTLSLPLNEGTHRRLGLVQTQIAKHHYAMLSWLAQRSKHDPSKPDRQVEKLEKQLNEELLKRFNCTIDTLGAVLLAQLFTRLDDMVKAVNTAPKESIKFECAKELLTKIQHFQRELKSMSALLTDPAFLADYPADLQKLLRGYGQSIGEMESVLSHGHSFEEGPLQTLSELAQEVMRRTAPSSPPPQRPLPPTPAGRPSLSDSTRARDTVLSREGANQIVQPLVSPAKPLVIRIDDTRKAAAAA